jgi:hypothetical protein
MRPTAKRHRQIFKNAVAPSTADVVSSEWIERFVRSGLSPHSIQESSRFNRLTRKLGV